MEGAFNNYTITKRNKILLLFALIRFWQPFPVHRMFKTLRQLLTLLVISSINATKNLLNISHAPPPPAPPPYTYCINYLDFDRVNNTQDLGSLLLFSGPLESIDFVGCQATRLKDGILAVTNISVEISMQFLSKGIQKFRLITEITIQKIQKVKKE